MKRNSELMLAAATTLFGTIGLIRRSIPLASSVIACVRGFVGAAFLLLLLLLRKKHLSKDAIKANGKLLVLSGAAIGLNWVLLFEAYNYTSVAIATLCYYMAPVFVMLLSPFVLGEKLTRRKLLCVLVALMGMVFVSGVFDEGMSGTGDERGILFGLGAAALYACVIMTNQKLHDIPTYDKTITQLVMASVVTLPYALLTQEIGVMSVSTQTIGLLLVAGVLQTGIAYALYFGSMDALDAQTVAIFGYIDPVVAILLSALILRETLNFGGIVGAILILGAAFVSELPAKQK